MLDDLFSSSRGPGLIGMLLGLVVLAGFTGLEMAVFDGRLNGDSANSTEKRAEAQAAEVMRLTNRAEILSQSIDRKRANSKLRDGAEMLKKRIALLGNTTEEVSDEVEGAKAAVEGLRQEQGDYRQAYRDAVRVKAVGEKIPELETITGKVYKSVTIKFVDALGLVFYDEAGPRRVVYEELPRDMQDYYQFSEAEAAAVREKKKVIDAGVTTRIVKGNKNKEAARTAWNEKQKKEQRKNSEQKIAKLEADITAAQGKIESELRKAADYHRMHLDALARGNISSHLVKAKKAEAAAESWQKGISAARSQIVELRSKLR